MLKYEPFFPKKKVAAELLPNSSSNSKAISNISQILQDFSDTTMPILEERDNSEKWNICNFNKTKEKVKKKTSSILQPVVDLRAVRQAAFTDGQNQKEKEKQIEIEKLKREKNLCIEELKKKHELEIVALRKNIVSTAKELEKGFRDGLQEIEVVISHQITKILAGFVKEKFIDTALRKFAENLAKEILHMQKPITIEGNRELLESLSFIVEDKTYYQFNPTDDSEIRVIGGAQDRNVNDNSVLSTRLMPWLKELEELSK